MDLFLPFDETPRSGELVPHHVGMVRLTCCNHPQHVWITKNIAPIGVRSVFFDANRVTHELECSCPITDLRVLRKQ